MRVKRLVSFGLQFWPHLRNMASLGCPVKLRALGLPFRSFSWIDYFLLLQVDDIYEPLLNCPEVPVFSPDVLRFLTGTSLTALPAWKSAHQFPF